MTETKNAIETRNNLKTHLKRAAEEVKTWPKWKQELLGDKLSNSFVEKAEAIARIAHQGTNRKFGNKEEYICHPERVASNFPDDPVRQAVAWIHDSIEDSDYCLEDLRREGFSEDIIRAVDLLTRKKGQNYCDFILACNTMDIARDVKIADIEDNLRDLKEGSLKDKYRLALYILTLDK